MSYRVTFKEFGRLLLQHMRFRIKNAKCDIFFVRGNEGSVMRGSESVRVVKKLRQLHVMPWRYRAIFKTSLPI